MTTTTAFKNTMVSAGAAQVTTIRIHSGATTDGTQNTITLTGAQAGATAEKACTYSATGASADLDAPVLIENLPANATVSHFSLFNGATFLATKAFNNSETYTAEGGKANITTAQITLADLA